MIASRQNLASLDDHATNRWIGAGQSHGLAGFAQGKPHVGTIEFLLRDGHPVSYSLKVICNPSLTQSPQIHDIRPLAIIT
ncbi:MAG: hypothetical protein OSB44_02710 [Verrucomicrobiales bacterium]|nr:hypothetical protein [Verrucomicrobiales bacterium]